MKVAIDVSPITPQRTGIGNYCFYLLRHMSAQAPEVEFKGFSSGSARVALEDLGARVSHRHIGVPSRALYAAWTWLGRPRLDDLLGGADIVHGTNFFLPPARRARRVLTVHDLAFVVRPDLCDPWVVGPFRKRVGAFARAADAVLVYSESTRADLERCLNVGGDKVWVAPLAVDEDFRPMPREAAAAQLREQHGLEGPFLLFVGAIEPRKNVENIVRAFGLLARRLPHRLVLAGAPGWRADRVTELIRRLGLRDRVVQPGYLSGRTALRALYSAADAFVFPTRYEGFGLPLLEAMACGCPVVTSDNSSVREVAGTAALYAPPEEPEAIAEAVNRVVGTPGLAESLAALGRSQVRKFSWDACAAATLRVYKTLAP